MTTPYIDPNLIFAENAPVQDKPAAFQNYDKGWDASRNNDGRPLIPQMNYLTQQADLKNLYIHENGAALPYKDGITYEENAVVVKDGVLQQWKGGEWVVVVKIDHNELAGRDVAGAHPASAITYGSISQEAYNNGVETIADMLAIENPKDGMRVYVKSHHAGWAAQIPYYGPRGGAEYIYNPARSVENDGCTILNGWELQSDILTLHHAGAKGSDVTADTLALTRCLQQTKYNVINPLDDIYYISPTRLERNADNKSLIGQGYNTEFRLIGDFSSNTPLLHFPPKVDSSYGIAGDSAQNFFIDQIRFNGTYATNALFQNTGLVIEDSTNVRLGTVWTHGFNKMGLVLSGSCKGFKCDKLFTWDNGNHVGENSPGGQGLGVVVAYTDELNAEFGEIVTYGNGLANYGLGFDFISGNIKVGTINAYDNGISGGKFVRIERAEIGTIYSTNNNKQAGETWGGIFMQQAYGKIKIGRYICKNPSGVGISDSQNCEHLEIGSIEVENAPVGPTLTLGTTASKKKVDLGTVAVKNGVGTLLQATGIESDYNIGVVDLDTSTANALVVSSRSFNLDTLITKNIETAYSCTLNLPSGLDAEKQNIHIKQVIATSTTRAAAPIIVNSGVKNAKIGKISTFGAYAAKIVDNGEGTRLDQNVRKGAWNYNPPSLAVGASSPISTLTVNGVAIGDNVEVYPAVDMQGCFINAWVSAVNTVSYFLHNPAGNPVGTVDLATFTVNFLIKSKM